MLQTLFTKLTCTIVNYWNKGNGKHAGNGADFRLCKTPRWRFVFQESRNYGLGRAIGCVIKFNSNDNNNNKRNQQCDQALVWQQPHGITSHRPQSKV